MHDTAYRIGTLAMNIYADLSTASVLEIGSQAVNGSLRDNALPTTRYVGIDLEKGDGVDLVVKPGEPLPVEDDDFDLVMASSVFEHDPMFWMTFLEMCKKTREGGYIYINAPSNGVVHRYPQDNWRFYPDSARALVKWAVSQGQHVSLVESFIAGREDDIWNDFVAVFRKGRITKALPSIFIHRHVTSWNVMTWKSKAILNKRDEPEDMVLLAEKTEALAEAERNRDNVVSQRDALDAELNVQRERLQDLDRIRNELGARENELREREGEIAQSRIELEQIRTERDELAARVSEARQQLENEVARRSEVEAVRDGFERVTKEQERLYSERLAMVHIKVSEAESAARMSEAQVSVRFKEIATLTSQLRQQEKQSEEAQEDAFDKMAWLQAVSERRMNKPLWWGFMPAEWQSRRERERLKRSGLFDGAAYLAHYPDVAVAGMDPLRHYLLHGLYEGRSRSFRNES